MSPRVRFRGAVLDSTDPLALARFCAALLGWPVTRQEPDGWAMLEDGDLKLEFQRSADYVPPVWPSEPGAPQQQVHLDFAVDDLDAAVARAVECGATVAAYQPQDDVRVLLDPAGHPFCLFVRP